LDMADFALRTCMCGHRVEGFDDYHYHLTEVARRWGEERTSA
jgi:hypothetical protein